ncbi:MAG: Gfo/Idh/MocA family oxidoreductase [Thermoguttaceae bacterium]|jgi:predicted dehydrogenase|nr:Gfo/Idh/MocA family oxidoreductase [Thermoguttaceae bacterium]
MTRRLSRRAFSQAGAVTLFGLTALNSSRVLGANERVRLGFIGIGSRGSQVAAAFAQHADTEIAALCDVSRSTLENANEKLAQGKAAAYGDFRKLLDRQNLDAVVIATPDHWHAIQTVMACRAGKDVYCEKPLSKTIHEGRRMVETARETNRIIQVGTHRRSGHSYAEAAELIASGKLGKVTVARAFDTTNMYPLGIGKAAPSDPPADLDWDMWLGPRPLRPFQATITPFKFRWWDLYATRFADNGIHFIDVMRWLTGDEAGPTRVTALGGRFVIDDDRTVPDVMEGMFQFGSDRLLIFGQYETSGHRALPRPAFAEFRGTQGALYARDDGFEVLPDRGGRYQDDREARMEPIDRQLPEGYAQHMRDHTRNFLDCLKSRERPRADVEIGHRSTSAALLANIALATESTIHWDPQREQITNLPEANQLLHYEYRKPWTLD